MKGSYRWLAVLSVVLMGWGLSACELNETCDPATDPDCIPADTGADQTTDTGTDQGGQFQTYHYVLVQDRDQNASGDRPGADIDAVELDKGGSPVYLSQVHESGRGDETPSGANADFNNAIGSPDADCGPGTTDPSDWDPNGFVSLGGDGGYFIGSFSGLAEIEAGDELTVYACAGELSEEWDLRVGLATTLNDPNWFMVIDGGVSRLSVNIPNLPQVPRN